MPSAPDLADLRSAGAPTGARIGVTDLSPFPEVERELERRTASGERAGLGFTYRDPRRASHPAASFPWARSIVVAAVPYLDDGDGPADRTVARFADGDRYDVVRGALAAIGGVLDRYGWRWEAVFDDDRLVDRALAVRAGVAWWGKSTMVLTPGHGPWILIGSVVTDAPLDPTPPMQRGCGTCTACLPACPTGAIVAPGLLDARRCLAAVLQARGPIPRELRRAVGARLYGCDDCLTACPPGDNALAVRDARRTVDPRDVLAMTDRDILDRFGHWYIPGRRPRFVRRNALVAVGNTFTDGDVGLVAGYLGNPDPLLRSHAAWALGQWDDPRAASILGAALEGEVDPAVREEIDAAVVHP